MTSLTGMSVSGEIPTNDSLPLRKRDEGALSNEPVDWTQQTGLSCCVFRCCLSVKDNGTLHRRDAADWPLWLSTEPVQRTREMTCHLTVPLDLSELSMKVSTVIYRSTQI